MSTETKIETVNLKALTDLLREIAAEQNWCGEAEDSFIAATHVEPLEWEPKRVRCNCGYSHCTQYVTKFPPESRFLLPEDAAESVPAAPIERALKARARYVLRSRTCCFSCEEDAAAEIAVFQRLADLLPGKPKLS